MIKYIIWGLLFLSCRSHHRAGAQFKRTSPADSASLLAMESKTTGLKSPPKLFDNHRPFEIISITNTLNKSTTDTDTSKCSAWVLTKPDIEKIIKNSETIDGTTWDLNFLVLSCTKLVNIVQGGRQYRAEVNAGSFLSISNDDTTILLGDYKKPDRKYFIGAPNSK